MSSFFSSFDPGLFVVNPTLFSGMAGDPVMPALINHDQPFTIWAAMPNDPALPPPSSSNDDYHNLSSSLLPVLVYEPLNCPDEILQEILSRVPAKHLVRFRTVCKSWKALTSTRYFLNNLHLKRCLSNSFAEILVEKQDPKFRNGKELYSIDTWREVLDTTTRRSSIQEFLQKGCLSCQESDYNAYAPGNKSTRLFLSFSSIGFVVLQDEKICEDPPSSSCCVIVNPLTREKVKLIIANDDAALCGQVCGLFFHPILGKICLLWGQQERLNSVSFEFKLLNLGSQSQSPFQSCWRNIVPRLHGLRPRSQSRGIVPPVILDNVLYWMVENIEDDGENDDHHADEETVKSRLQTYCKEAILAFDITKEEFDLLPHPGPCCDGSDKNGIKNHQWMQLLQTNNSHLLWLCEFSTSEKLINIWVRQSSSEEEGGGAIWSIMHTIDNSQFCSVPPDFQAIGMVDKELLLVQWVGFGLCVHNLKLGTVELFETKSGMESNQHFSAAAFVCAHSPSLLTMTNSKRAETVVEVPTSIRRLKRLGDVIY